MKKFWMLLMAVGLMAGFNFTAKAETSKKPSTLSISRFLKMPTFSALTIKHKPLGKQKKNFPVFLKIKSKNTATRFL